MCQDSLEPAGWEISAERTKSERNISNYNFFRTDPVIFVHKMSAHPMIDNEIRTGNLLFNV